MVGTSGHAAIRSLPAMARARTLPPSTSGFAAVKKVKVACTAPVATALAASPEPRYGTSTIFVPAAWLSWVSAIAGEVEIGRASCRERVERGVVAGGVE